MIPKLLITFSLIPLFLNTCEPIIESTEEDYEVNEVRTFSSVKNGMVVKLTYMLGSYDKDSKVKEIARNAQHVFHESEELIEHIDKIKAKTFSILLYGPESQIRKEVYSDRTFHIGLDSMRSLVGLYDSKVNSTLMVGNSENPSTNDDIDGNNYRAEVLHDQLKKYQAELVKMCSNLDSGKGLESKILNNDFFELQENSGNKHPESWSVRNFYEVPLVATTAHLSVLQSQVLTLSSWFINDSYETVKRIEKDKGLK